jgi:pantoate--beta-alanine ligase
MQTVQTVEALRAQLKQWRGAGQRIALVPTMGNLHAGHLSLVGEARTRAERVVVSIFVNPMQFGPSEDYASYPRTLEQDTAMLNEAGTDLLFAPEAATVYPAGREAQTRVEVPVLSELLCGAARPGHFVGVATVVCKLLNMVQPDLVLFGEKDFQQLMVLRRMVVDLCIPVAVLGVATVREPDGLAMSSRNQYLNPEQRKLAPMLYRTLTRLAERVRSGQRDLRQLERDAREALAGAGFVPDYVSIRRCSDLAEAVADDRDLVVLAAARLGAARLIDNLRI